MKGKYMSNKNKIPVFSNEDDERDFWSKEDSTNYIDWTKAKETVLPNLKPSLKTISLRLPESMIHSLKMLANKSDIPYQSLIKIILKERLDKESSLYIR
jgi:predicted DNA binding CopG/RHH family protein